MLEKNRLKGQILETDPMAASNITIQLGKTKLTPEFIEILNGIFSHHGLTPCLVAQVTPLDPSGPRETEWSNITNILASISGFLVQYYGGTQGPPWVGPDTSGSFPQFSLGVNVYLNFSRETNSDMIFMHASAGPKSYYSAEEKADALTIQEITLQLHKKFNALDSCAIGENEETSWFHFSKAEWKPLGDLPARD